jgi:hypothetical protein
VVLAVCALALPCAASAEPIVTLGTTAGPASAVTDGAGTLHAVWHTYEQQGGPDMLSYCRIPAGGTTCTPTILGGFPSIVVGDPRLLLRRQDGALIIVVPGNDDQARNVTFLLASIDVGPPGAARRSPVSACSTSTTPSSRPTAAPSTRSRTS